MARVRVAHVTDSEIAQRAADYPAPGEHPPVDRRTV